jgi:hypothetical protein
MCWKNLTPVQCRGPDDDRELFYSVIRLYHQVLPNLKRSYLRKYLVAKNVRTLVMIHPDPEQLERRAASYGDEEEECESDSGEESASSGVDEDGAESGEKGAPSAAAPRPGAFTPVAGLVGALSFEQGSRLGQDLLQVGVVGVDIRFQHAGVGGQLLRAVLSGQATSGRPDAAIVWADLKAVLFFRRHGFDDDLILNARYKDISDEWARSILMSVQAAHPLSSPPPSPPS